MLSGVYAGMILKRFIFFGSTFSERFLEGVSDVGPVDVQDVNLLECCVAYHERDLFFRASVERFFLIKRKIYKQIIRSLLN